MSTFRQLYTSPKGRTGRRTYILFLIVPNLCAGIALSFLPRAEPNINQILILLITLLLLWPNIAMSIKRVHDFDRSGWWLLVWCALTIGIALTRLPHAILYNQLVSDAGFVLLMAIPGSNNPNRYGEKP